MDRLQFTRVTTIAIKVDHLEPLEVTVQEMHLQRQRLTVREMHLLPVPATTQEMDPQRHFHTTRLGKLLRWMKGPVVSDLANSDYEIVMVMSLALLLCSKDAQVQCVKPAVPRTQ